MYSSLLPVKPPSTTFTCRIPAGMVLLRSGATTTTRRTKHRPVRPRRTRDPLGGIHPGPSTWVRPPSGLPCQVSEVELERPDTRGSTISSLGLSRSLGGVHDPTSRTGPGTSGGLVLPRSSSIICVRLTCRVSYVNMSCTSTLAVPCTRSYDLAATHRVQPYPAVREGQHLIAGTNSVCNGTAIIDSSAKADGRRPYGTSRSRGCPDAQGKTTSRRAMVTPPPRKFIS